MRILLASASPRRAALMAAAGFEFDVHPVDLDERWRPGEQPDEYVTRLAEEKAARALVDRPGALALAADTVVLVDGRILGKPAGDADAAEMLRLLSGRVHTVLTGICLQSRDQCASLVDRTSVRFMTLSEQEIAWYVASGEPRDKAGAYAVQGLASRFVEEIHGSYTNVVGLPVAAVYQLLKALGV
jgi:septum formation protein